MKMKPKNIRVFLPFLVTAVISGCAIPENPVTKTTINTGNGPVTKSITDISYEINNSTSGFTIEMVTEYEHSIDASTVIKPDGSIDHTVPGGYQLTLDNGKWKGTYNYKQYHRVLNIKK